MSDRPVTIFGAGLAGALMAVYLARRGFRVELFERRPDPRAAGIERGRSINLALSTRGIDALARVGLVNRVLADAIPMRGRMIHARAVGPEALSFQPYSRDPTRFINSVSRAGLNLTLIEAADSEPGVTIRFGVRCLGVDFENRRAEVQDVVSGASRTIDVGTVIGADGAFSGVRGSMQTRDRFDYHQSYLTHGYKELTIPPSGGEAVSHGLWRIEKNALHIWPRGRFMMIALPNADGSFTCTLFWPLEGPDSFAALRGEDQILAFFRDQFPDAVPLIPDLPRQFIQNPTSSLVTIRCAPWHVGGGAVLIGDAAHAVVPFYGQGMNASFEDCRVLAECLDQASGPNASESGRAFAFKRYQALRKQHTDALATLAVENFIEMRDKVADPLFRKKKALEHFLEDRFPRWYQSLYAMVTFSTIPYAEAVKRAQRQDRVLAAGASVLLLVLVVLIWLAV